MRSTVTEIRKRDAQVQGLHHEFDIGGTGRRDRYIGGRCHHDVPHLPPISVSPRIPATYLQKGMLFFSKNVEKRLKNRQMLEGIIPLAFRIGGGGGGHVPRVPPRGAAMLKWTRAIAPHS